MIKTTSIETLFYFYRIIVFILKLITKKPPPLAMVHFFKLICGVNASLQQTANDYFFAAKRAAASSQFTTFQNSLM
ncbi:hypothetical protein F9A99_19185 [Escherichia coli]|nr:hypothetical protein [Escherichia coli]EFH3056967.1 hypothetical protein [Escherichia coli]EFH4381396.1 hypothetical protein [Escherichia coli]EFO0356272.1 hypothetical protein [Escherichia coli]MTE72620.1 hypothetical protein [Escherichia coli]